LFKATTEIEIRFQRQKAVYSWLADVSIIFCGKVLGEWDPLSVPNTSFSQKIPAFTGSDQQYCRSISALLFCIIFSFDMTLFHLLFGLFRGLFAPRFATILPLSI
jgi:hypothetical protein